MTKSLQSVGVNDKQSDIVVPGPHVVPDDTRGQTIVPKSSWSDKVPPMMLAIVATAVLVAFGFAYACMFEQAKSNPPYWDKLVYLYNSIMTIVIAAASALFGVQISSGQARAAREQADSQKARADKIEGNVKALQRDLSKAPSPSERASLSDQNAISRRVMTLLH